MKIGLVGEAPSDTSAIKNLFSKHYANLEFVVLLNGLTGAMMDSKRFIAQFLPKEFHDKKPDLVILIRDLDGHERDTTKLKQREKLFNFFNQKVANKGMFLLNIYELEAMIFADISVFNSLYGCNLDEFDDPMKVAMPKEILIKASRYKFNESHNPRIFNLLNFDVIKKNCRYFARFIKEFDKRLM